ncbi:MAG: PEPxxWA-CTERM sorting domain-containing protein [Sphingomonas sp.]
MKFYGVLSTVWALVLASPADARTLQFTISGDYSAKFRLQSSPTPDFVDHGFLFALGAVPFSRAASGFADISFFNDSATGGILINDGFDFLFDANGVQLYAGTEAAPTFRQGQFALTGLSTPGNFTIAISAVPEPQTWAMMIVGMGFAGGAIRYRRRSLAVSFAK